jgi:pSer/pThr/pTyr-binding forkhead associated (FHA) protein
MTNISQPDSRSTASDNTPRPTIQRIRPPLTFSTQAAPWRIIMEVGSETITPLTFEISNQLTIGRSDLPDNYVPGLDLGPYGAQDAGVSRRHALIFVSENGLQLRDLGSTNGTLINGFALEPNQPYKLNEGDEIEFGHLRTMLHIVKQPGG